MNITDEMLFEAAPEAAERWLSALPDRDACGGHTFSPAFEGKMRPLLRRRRRAWKGLVLLAAALAALVFGVYANRPEDYRVLVSQQEGVVTYRVRPEDSGLLLEPRQMTPGWLPEGFFLEYASSEKGRFVARYCREPDKSSPGFTLTQWCGESSNCALVGDYNVESVRVDGEEAVFVSSEKKDFGVLLWTAGANGFELSARGMELEELIKIAEYLEW